MNGPGVLCIGAQKAGTTWLYDNLSLHPEIWLPPVKELHYFDVKYPPTEIAGGEVYQHIRGLHRYRPLLRNPSFAVASWLWRFYRQPLTDQGYLDLFPGNGQALSGDITPAYSTLDEPAVAAVECVVPKHCKVLFILRHPVDRLWSALQANARNRNLDLSSMSDESLLALSRNPAHRLRSDYARTLRNWERFGERLGVFFYEDLSEDAESFLASVLEFLDVDSSWRSPRVHEISNPGGHTTGPPERLDEALWGEARPLMRIVAQKVGRLPARWEEDLQAMSPTR